VAESTSESQVVTQMHAFMSSLSDKIVQICPSVGDDWSFEGPAGTKRDFGSEILAKITEL
jgi:hypothetical protein